MAKELWTEKYRPNTVDGYVFRDMQHREQVEAWIKEQSIPHLLFSGSAGVGKCIAGTEEILVEIDTVSLTNEQAEKLSQYQLFSREFKIPIKALFEILNIDQIAYDTPVAISTEIKIKSPNGFVKINAFVKKQHQIATYYLKDCEFSCSIDHLVFENGVPTRIRDCKTIDTVTGSKDILRTIMREVDDVYDVALDDPHQYVTPNGIIHHNTTLAKILIEQLGVQDSDVMIANGSKEARKIEWVDKLIGFCQTMPFGEFKVVLIDEADYMNINSVQPALRNLMEDYSHTVRFMLTCNYPNKIMPAIHSRCQSIHIEKTDPVEFTARVATILVEENVDFDLDTLDTYVKATYPDLRKCINNLQMNSLSGILKKPEESSGSNDYRLEMVSLFKAGKISEARMLICSQASPEEMVEIYRWLYDNISLFGDDAKQEKAILVIKQGLVDHTLVIDPEINLAATLIRLGNL